LIPSPAFWHAQARTSVAFSAGPQRCGRLNTKVGSQKRRAAAYGVG